MPLQDFMPDKFKAAQKKFKSAKQDFKRFKTELSDAIDAANELKDVSKVSGVQNLDRVWSKIVIRFHQLEQISGELERAEPILVDKDYRQRMLRYDRLRNGCDEVTKGLDELDTTIKNVQKATGAPFRALLQRNNGIRTEVETMASNGKKDQDRLKRWWKSLQKDGALVIPLDPRVTDILEHAKKLTIAMPKQQTFAASARYKGVPQVAVSDFRTDVTGFFQKNAKTELDGVKKEIAQTLKKLDDNFQIADKNGDDKSAQTAFDNINDLISKQVPGKLEKAIRAAAEKSLTEVKAQKGKGYVILMGKTGTKLDGVDVNTSGFFRVELVLKDSNPASDLVDDFLDDVKSLQKDQAKFEASVEDVTGGWNALNSSLTSLSKEISHLEQQLQNTTDFTATVKDDTRTREQLIDDFAGQISDVKSAGEELEKLRGSMASTVDSAIKSFGKESKKFKDNQKVNKRLLEDFNLAAGKLQKHLAKNSKLQKAIQKVSVELMSFQMLRVELVRILAAKDIARAKLDESSLPGRLQAAVREVTSLQATAKQQSRSAGNALSVSDEIDDMTSAAGKLQA